MFLIAPIRTAMWMKRIKKEVGELLSNLCGMWFPPKFPGRHLITLKHTLYFLSAVGFFSIPPNEYTLLYDIFYNFYFLLSISCTITVTIFTGIDLLRNLQNIDVLTDRTVVIAALFLILTKQNSLVRHKPLIEAWVAEVQRRYMAANEIQRIRFTEDDKKTLYYVKVFFVIWILITISYIYPVFLGPSNQFELPTGNAAFFGVDSVLKYILVYTWNTVAMSLAVLSVFAVDIFMVGMYNYAVSRLQVLGDAFENVGRDNPKCKKYGTMERCRSCRLSSQQFFQKSIAEHCNIMKFVAELNQAFYWTLLMQSILVALLVAGCQFYGFVSILHGNITRFVQSMIYISAVIFENWLYCKFGDRLKYASSNVTDALWKSHWYRLNKQERTYVLIIIRASKKPLYMEAGKLFRMDLEHFRFILSSAYSYFTVLRNFV